MMSRRHLRLVEYLRSPVHKATILPGRVTMPGGARSPSRGSSRGWVLCKNRAVRQARANECVRRGLRRDLGLGIDEVVWSTWVGPPALSLERRADVLQALRAELAGEHWEIESDTPMRTLFRKRAPRLTGPDALDALKGDERQADARGHWWLHRVTWRDQETTSRIWVDADPDGNDIRLLGWGDRPAAMMERLLRVLLPK
jgi:hypothetical protein